MVYGIGIDIETHNRFQKYLNADGKPDDFLVSVFSENELNNYRNYPGHLCYALSFSCKEAFYKALGRDWGDACMWLDIELLFDDAPGLKKARVEFGGRAKDIALSEGISLPPEFDYSMDEHQVIFKALLRCKKD
jgi:phosphopantetheine--protein transferase-like protein